MLQFYGYSKCSTCRKAEKTLQSLGQSFNVHDITTQPPTRAMLKGLLSQGIPLSRLYNTSGEMYRRPEVKKKIASMNEEEQLEFLAANGRLIKRPIVFGKDRSSVGFKEEDFRKTWA